MLVQARQSIDTSTRHLHILADFYGVQDFGAADYIRDALKRAADVAKATILKIEIRTFDPNDGVTGFALLAESHISIHTWPEHNFAAIDIFMCGKASPERALQSLKQSFNPEDMKVMRAVRGF